MCEITKLYLKVVHIQYSTPYLRLLLVHWTIIVNIYFDDFLCYYYCWILQYDIPLTVCSSCLWIVWLEYHIANYVRVKFNTTYSHNAVTQYKHQTYQNGKMNCKIIGIVYYIGLLVLVTLYYLSFCAILIGLPSFEKFLHFWHCIIVQMQLYACA